VRPNQRKAFTLLEILTVIAIIAILVTLLTLGVSHINKTAKDRATHVALDNLKSLLAERKLNDPKLNALNTIYDTTSWTGAGNPKRSEFAPGDAKALAAPILAKGPNSIEAANPLGATLLVMNLLKAVPNNARTLGGLPSNSTRLYSAVVANSNPPIEISAPLLLDGWGNPILFVPGRVKDPTTGVEDPNSGLLTVYVTGDNGKPSPKGVQSPDGQGFWVSAGADGFFGILPGGNGQVDVPPGSVDDIAGGDDNVYSFGQ
jgi:prepilin-type N-terminal cleavage/methylation domain-containing protein